MSETSESADSPQQECPNGLERPRPLRVLLAGGGTAGHVSPLLATAAVLRGPALGGDPDTQTLVLGTIEKLEKWLVSEAGLELTLAPKVSLSWRPSGDLLRLPHQLGRAVSAATEAIEKVKTGVAADFGGYVLTLAYLTVRKAGVPVAIHEQNVRLGPTDRLDTSWIQVAALAFASTRLKTSESCTEVTGLSPRPAIATLVAQHTTDEGIRQVRAEGAQTLGLGSNPPTLLVTDGSLGAQHLNEILDESLHPSPTGLQVLHLTGKDKGALIRAALEAAVASGAAQDLVERCHAFDCLTTMEQACTCADGVLCHFGAGTIAEITALGLPTLYVPLSIGNGGQRLSTAGILAPGGGCMVLDAELKPSDIPDFAMFISDPERQAAMARVAASAGTQDAAARLTTLIRQCAPIHGTSTGEENVA